MNARQNAFIRIKASKGEDARERDEDGRVRRAREDPRSRRHRPSRPSGSGRHWSGRRRRTAVREGPRGPAKDVEQGCRGTIRQAIRNAATTTGDPPVPGKVHGPGMSGERRGHAPRNRPPMNAAEGKGGNGSFPVNVSVERLIGDDRGTRRDGREPHRPYGRERRRAGVSRGGPGRRGRGHKRGAERPAASGRGACESLSIPAQAPELTCSRGRVEIVGGGGEVQVGPRPAAPMLSASVRCAGIEPRGKERRVDGQERESRASRSFFQDLRIEGQGSRGRQENVSVPPDHPDLGKTARSVASSEDRNRRRSGPTSPRRMDDEREDASGARRDRARAKNSPV